MDFTVPHIFQTCWKSLVWLTSSLGWRETTTSSTGFSVTNTQTTPVASLFYYQHWLTSYKASCFIEALTRRFIRFYWCELNLHTGCIAFFHWLAQPFSLSVIWSTIFMAFLLYYCKQRSCWFPWIPVSISSSTRAAWLSTTWTTRKKCRS